jgi:hypothetical protein
MQRDSEGADRTDPVAVSRLDPRIASSPGRATSLRFGPVRDASIGLPVPRFPDRCRASEARYVVTAADARGRIADRSPLRFLGWPPGMRVAIELRDGLLILVSAGATGNHAITKQGHLCLPLAVRRVCHIEAGDRVLVAARPESSDLVVVSTAVLDVVLYPQLVVGERTERHA